MDNKALEQSFRTIGILHNPLVAWAILALSLLLTVVAYYVSERFVRERARDRFEFRSLEIENTISDRLELYEQVLWGGVGLINASSLRVTREEFANYVGTLNIDTYWPGIQGIGFSVPLTAAEKGVHVARIRAEGFTDYDISPAGDRDFYTAIVYLEPFDWRNRRAFGYDMWSNDTRREAMARARDQGVAATSGLITLVQETDDDVQPGFLIYVPVYRTRIAPATLEQRRAQFVGWIYAPFRAHDLMRGVLAGEDPAIEFQIYDGETVNPDTLLYDSNPVVGSGAGAEAPDFSHTVVVRERGRPWTLHFQTPGDYWRHNEEKNQPLYVALAGGIVDTLLFYVIYMLYIANKRGEAVTRERYEIINQAPNALIITRHDGAIALTNHQADMLFGYAAGELIGQSIEALVPAAVRLKHPDLRAGFLHAPSARPMGAGRDLYGCRKDGREVPIEIGLNPITIGQTRYVLASVVDISERRRAQRELESGNQRLREKNQEMEQFIYTISHDLKSPLVTIGGFSESLLNSVGDALTDKQHHQLSRIRANVTQMENLLNDLLALSRLIRREFDKDPVDTLETVEQAISALESSIVDSGANIAVKTPLLPLYGNDSLIYQCIQNLLSNAIRYRDPNRGLEIVIETLQHASLVELAISDNGIGIAPQHQEKIFRIFERLHVGEGSGVGLAIVKTVMEKHGGSVALRSEPGVGSTFSLLFPTNLTDGVYRHDSH